MYDVSLIGGASYKWTYAMTSRAPTETIMAATAEKAPTAFELAEPVDAPDAAAATLPPVSLWKTEETSQGEGRSDWHVHRHAKPCKLSYLVPVAVTVPVEVLVLRAIL